MQRHKLGFRNRTALEQIIICERMVANIVRTPEEHRAQVQLTEAADAVAAARASHERIASLKAELRSEISRRKELLRDAREKVTRASGMVAVNLGFQPSKMLAAGLELESPKLPVGKPSAPGNLRAEPDARDGAVRLRYERPVRRCVFEVQFKADSGKVTEWQQYDPGFRQNRLVKGLTSGVKYWFRVRAVNAHGPGPWSGLATARVK